MPGSLPDVITLYRKPILTVCRNADEVAPRVLKVLGHEVGHALGLSEGQLRGLRLVLTTHRRPTGRLSTVDAAN